MERLLEPHLTKLQSVWNQTGRHELWESNHRGMLMVLGPQRAIVNENDNCQAHCPIKKGRAEETGISRPVRLGPKKLQC